MVRVMLVYAGTRCVLNLLMGGEKQRYCDGRGCGQRVDHFKAVAHLMFINGGLTTNHSNVRYIGIILKA